MIRTTRAACIAILCLLAGTAAPLTEFVSVIVSAEKTVVTIITPDLDDGEDSLQGMEHETDEVQAILVAGLRALPQISAATHSFTIFNLIFKEHHPELLTPPPRSLNLI